MKQIKLFFMLLLSLVGMTAMAQETQTPAPTCAVGGDPVKTLDDGGQYYIGVSWKSLHSEYFNIGEKKLLREKLTDAQLFTINQSADGWTLKHNGETKDGEGAYVKLIKDTELTTCGEEDATKFSLDIPKEYVNAVSIYGNENYVIHGGIADKAGLTSDAEYMNYWYFYKSATATVKYKVGDQVIATHTYSGMLGDKLAMPGMITVEGVKYTVKAGDVTKTVQKAEDDITVEYETEDVTAHNDLEDGFYFLQSAINDANNPNDVWMTSMRTVVALLPEARNFWSVWDVQYVKGSNNLYTFRNVGNNKVMTPATDPTKELKTDNGILYYDKEYHNYKVGFDPNDGNDDKRIAQMKLVKLGENSYTIQPYGIERPAYYMAIDSNDDCGEDESQNQMLADHSLKSIAPKTNNHIWNFEKVTSEYIQGENGLYNHGVQDLNGYVGGLTTMDVPKGEDPNLGPIKAVIDKYTDDLKNLTGDVEDAAERYKAFIDKVNEMRANENNKIFCQELTETRPFWVETIGSRKAYKSRLITEGNRWSNRDQDKVHEGTPEGTFSIQIHEGEGNGNGYVIDPKSGRKTYYKQYYTMKNGDGKYFWTPSETHYPGIGTNTENYTIDDKTEGWEKWSKDMRYITGRPAGWVFQVYQTKDEEQALQFVIVPIIPGIYQISQIAKSWQGDPYLTFNGGAQVDCYRVAEAYSYFKFKTYNTCDYIVKEVGEGKHYVGSYGNFMHTEIVESDVDAYYIRAGKYGYHNEKGATNENMVDDAKAQKNADGTRKETSWAQMTENDWGVEWTNMKSEGYQSTLTVYLDQIPKVEDKNLIQGKQGVILKSHENQPHPAGKGIVSDQTIGDWSAQDLADNNMLQVALNDIGITDENYYDYFVLAYREKGKPFGTWYDKPVNGVGLGFYHVNRGSKIPKGKCYLATSDLCTQLAKRYNGSDGTEPWDDHYLIRNPKDKNEGNSEAASNSRAAAPAESSENVVAGVRLVFRDCNGVFTGIEEAPIIDIEEDELEALTTLYSLDGKPVATPKSGEIYILNGKKVMF